MSKKLENEIAILRSVPATRALSVYPSAAQRKLIEVATKRRDCSLSTYALVAVLKLLAEDFPEHAAWLTDDVTEALADKRRSNRK